VGLDLYSKIEPYLELEEEVKELHSAFLGLIFEKNLNDIIDIGCGQGAFMMHLLANGVEAYGIDLSVEQIKVCQSFNLRADAMDIKDVEDTFACATAIFDVLNYIPQNSLEDFLKNTHKILNENGYFIFDVNTLFGFEEIAQGSLNINQKDKFIAIDALFENNELQTDMTLFSKEKNNTYTKEQDSITQYYHTLDYLKNALKNAGFVIENVINFNLHSDADADKYVFVCKKI